ncbi:hypothetical protein Gotri_015575, partial [Gossypium trilobum]|nr:hypothetical protein [Gossypium trilobum]
VEQLDLQQLTVTEAYDTEPFPNAASSRSLTVIDESRRPWTFDYRVTRRGRVLCDPHWQDFIRQNRVQVGDTVSIERNDGHGYRAPYNFLVLFCFVEADKRQLKVTLTETTRNEVPAELTVKDAVLGTLTLKRTRTGNQMTLSGDGCYKLHLSGRIAVGDRITIERIGKNEYRIVEVIS